MHRSSITLLAAAILALALAGCAGSPDKPTLVIAGIPDEQVSILEERFGGIATYLSRETGLKVRYQPSISYAALVTAFEHGDVSLAWFGGLTGVQARIAAPGAKAVAQRPRDQEFRSVFIVGPGVAAASLQELRGLSFTFGSESSTSGHLMPRYFMVQEGIDPERDLRGRPSYSGSHDKTWKLVEAGTFDAGVLNQAVWERAVKEDQVDTTRVRPIYVTPPYFDYHWVIGPNVDKIYGNGTAARVQQALLSMNGKDEDTARTLALFQTDSFVGTKNDNYSAIESTARSLGLIQ
ncbi:MAG: putative selenate ABC transporter substrate-binding protein [Chloroflexi bacterium]|nr:putative selenate ABC transporter substrate-binding protein [Chloroflexota bacterium]